MKRSPTLGILRIPLHIIMRFRIKIKSSLMIFLHSQLLIKLWMMIESQSIIECRQRQDWPKWEEAIKAELASLAKREVFGPITCIPDNVKPVGYKWVFVRK